jgi:hypothetical protein
MRHLLILLPLCLLLAPGRPTEVPSARLAPQRSEPAVPLVTPLPTAAEMEHLAQTDPVAFLENCLRRYRLHVQARPEIAAGVAAFAAQPLGASPWTAAAALMGGSSQVGGYSLLMQKRETIDGKLNPEELVEVHFREHPHSVYMNWLKGQGRAERALYVAGENNGKALVRPRGVIARLAVGDIYPIDPEGPDARSGGRYTLPEFGLKKATERTLAFLRSDLAKGIVRVEYRGVQKVKQAGDRPCYTFQYTYAKLQADGVSQGTLHYDQDTWLQVGSTLLRPDGSPVAYYYFRDIRLNPPFRPSQFQPVALKP